VIALGGGVVGDLAGFLAATWMRGVPFVQVPTTVLAMADASVGGKVAVDLPRGKNLVGAFHQPDLVWMDVATLRSLPRRQRANGLVEVIKHGEIRDVALIERFERDNEAILELEPGPTLDVLERSCQIKAEVVAQDEREAGLRMILNFGHTLAHAVETLLGYRKLLHGEAVAIGMVFAARRSEALGLADIDPVRAAVLARLAGRSPVSDALTRCISTDSGLAASKARSTSPSSNASNSSAAASGSAALPLISVTRKRRASASRPRSSSANAAAARAAGDSGSRADASSA
jgi:3-dehydroquinate synthase